MPDSGPRLERLVNDSAATLVLSGEWIAHYCKEVESLAQIAPTDVSRLTIDLGRIRRLDTFGAWSIKTMHQSATTAGVSAQLVGVSDQNVGLLSQMDKATLSVPAVAKPRGGLLDIIEGLGRTVAAVGEDLLALLAMLGSLLVSLLAGVRRPRTIKWKSLIYHIDQAGVRAVPIIVLMTFLIGCIIAQQSFFYFRKFGATEYVIDLVTILVLREIGVLLVTILVAGRSGSSYTAEIGSMKMREEIDALRTMGLDPVDVLILPRVLALVVAVPVLTFIGVIAALYGAGIVAWTYGGMSPASFFTRLQQAFSYTDFEVGMIKAPVMALVIGTVASVEGLRVAGSTTSLGLRTTASVVKTIFLVIVLDGAFAIIFASVGM
jgi:phospholipid/cholesterol/gamma-HCH transport system permease protein